VEPREPWFLEWDDSIPEGQLRPAHRHDCRQCGDLRDCFSEECRLRADALCPKCWDQTYDAPAARSTPAEDFKSVGESLGDLLADLRRIRPDREPGRE
jgi:hypothetical protein